MPSLEALQVMDRRPVPMYVPHPNGASVRLIAQDSP
jgi:hypothetical protein